MSTSKLSRNTKKNQYVVFLNEMYFKNIFKNKNYSIFKHSLAINSVNCWIYIIFKNNLIFFLLTKFMPKPSSKDR